jgi:uncharacterized protein YecT (DUF1311 family)
MRLLTIPLLFIPLIVSAGEARIDCYQSASTQTDLTVCSGSKLKDADDGLNRIYQAIRIKYAKNPEFLRKLKSAQLAWIKFRDAEMDALFPVEDPYYYGSVMPMCQADWLRKITEQRITELKRWLEPVEEGDICSGSIGQYGNE